MLSYLFFFYLKPSLSFSGELPKDWDIVFFFKKCLKKTYIWHVCPDSAQSLGTVIQEQIT